MARVTVTDRCVCVCLERSSSVFRCGRHIRGCMKVHISSALPAVPSHLTLSYCPCPSSDHFKRSIIVLSAAGVFQSANPSHVHCITENSLLGRVQLFSHRRVPYRDRRCGITAAYLDLDWIDPLSTRLDQRHPTTTDAISPPQIIHFQQTQGSTK